MALSLIASLGKAAVGGLVCGMGVCSCLNPKDKSAEIVLLTTIGFVALRAISLYVGLLPVVWGLTFAALALTIGHDINPQFVFGGFCIGASLGYLLETIFQSNAYFLL